MKITITALDSTAIVTTTSPMVTCYTTTAEVTTVVGGKLDRLDTLKLYADRIMHDDADLLRELAKH